MGQSSKSVRQLSDQSAGEPEMAAPPGRRLAASQRDLLGDPRAHLRRGHPGRTLVSSLGRVECDRHACLRRGGSSLDGLKCRKLAQALRV